MIEDDPNVSSFVKKGLCEDGFHTDVCHNGEDGIERFNSGKHDLIILDIMLPTISGLEVCSRIRKQSQVPILMLTALGTAENVALGLNTGADDYLVKPFKFIELTARVKSLLRRSENNHVADNGQDAIYAFSDIVLNDTTKTVLRNEQEIVLTTTEYNLLKMFISHPRRVLSRSEILESVWGVDFDLGTNVVDVYINYLRKKLEAADQQRVIHTVIGMGYVLKET